MPRGDVPEAPEGRGERIVEALRVVVERSREQVRASFPGEGGERAFRFWLFTDFLARAMGWPGGNIAQGEIYDYLLQESPGRPIVYIETKAPGHRASDEERRKFEERLAAYGTLRAAYLTNGSEWERLDLLWPRGVLQVRRRATFRLEAATAEEAEAFFAPLLADRHLPGAGRPARLGVASDAPHVLARLADDLHDAIGELSLFLGSLQEGFREGRAGAAVRSVARELLHLWCVKSLIVPPPKAAAALAEPIRAGLPARDLAAALTELNIPGCDAVAVAEALSRLPRKAADDSARLEEAVLPAYGDAIARLCAQTAHVIVARLLLYRIGEDTGVFERVVAGLDLEAALAAPPTAVDARPKPALGLMARVQERMQEFLPTVYKLGEFDWWLVTPAKRAALGPDEKSWLAGREGEFEPIACRLLRMLDGYRLDQIDVDVWRNVYQHYLPPDERQRLGGFYTPEDLVHLVLDLAEYTADTPDLCALTFIDPACGSGAFVTSALTRLLDHLDRDLPCHRRTFPRSQPDWKRSEAVLQAVERNLHAVDIHPFAAFLTALGVFFIMLPHYARARKKNPEIVFDPAIFSADSLKKHGVEEIDPTLFRALNSRVQLSAESYRRYRDLMRQHFHRVFGNPPWGGVLKGPLAPVYDAESKRYFAREYQAAAQGKYDVYGLFMERALQLLRSEGRFALLTQGTFIDKEWAAGLRARLASEAIPRVIADLNPFGPLFFKAMNNPCVTVVDAVKKDAIAAPRGDVVALLSSPPQDFRDLDAPARRRKVVETVVECVREAGRRERPVVVGFATASRVPLRRLREMAEAGWDLSASKALSAVPDDWPPITAVLEPMQGVTPGGCLDVFLMPYERARKDLEIEENVVYPAVKSPDLARWRVAWSGLGLIYPYEDPRDWRKKGTVPAFHLESYQVPVELEDAVRRLGVTDGLDFDHPLDRREEEIVRRRGVNRQTAPQLLQHRISMGLVKYIRAATYLVEHYERLEERVFKKKNIRDFGRQWYEYLWPRDMRLMLSRPRILTPGLIREVRFSLDTEGHLADHATFLLQVTEKTKYRFDWLRGEMVRVLDRHVSHEQVLMYCLAFLNSRAAQDRLTRGQRPTPRGSYQITEAALARLPIPRPAKKRDVKAILDLVRALVEGDDASKAAEAEAKLARIVDRILPP